MKSIKLFVLPILLVSFLFACKNSAPKQETAATTQAATASDTAKMANTNVSPKDTTKEEIKTVSAMFVSFTLGDGEHYTFKDKAGKEWNFGGCEDEKVKFGVELPEAQANETNQGWGSNKTLQKKWFDIKYVIRTQPEYIDGPMAKVPVIVEAVMQK